MFTLSQLISIICAAIVLIIVVDMLRRGKLKERHALWWLFAGIVALVTTLFPGLINNTARMLGIAEPLNLAFFGAIIVLFLVNMQQASELTRVEEKTRVLAEQVALLEDRLRKLEGDEASTRPSDESE